MIKPSISGSTRILQDLRSNGKERPWKLYKEQSLSLAGSFKRLGLDNKFSRVKDCGGLLEFKECPQGHEKRLKSAKFCQVRLCAMCAARRSTLIFHNLRQVVHLAQEKNLHFLFLTLTAKTVDGNSVCDEITNYFESWKRLSRKLPFKRSVKGWFRVLEVTHNWKKDTYHPHFHCLIAVQPSYFGGNKYIKQSDWAQMWKEAMRLDYTPIVDVRRVRPKRAGQKTESAVIEASKYAVKPGDYIIEENQRAQDRAVELLDDALRSRRLVAYGGVLKEIRKELKMKDEDKADLIKVDEQDQESCQCSVCHELYQEVLYKWHVGYRNYVQMEGE